MIENKMTLLTKEKSSVVNIKQSGVISRFKNLTALLLIYRPHITKRH